ncbi:PREDICTED: T-cell surface antigen CD2 [Tinamus guttatus]|uniref:T-cell surface antigen CD2 n=1 Tax=Tinamus guttatus TaxID=94827 RepID=UPI00052E7CA7|nr:PREDICTED: T-cell surface antigen CD2 [Tinamus guttatus]
MNSGRLFLVKFLLLLFSSVKCAVNKTIYVAVNDSVLLNVAAAFSGNIREITWSRDQKLLQIKDKKPKYYVNKDQCRCMIFLNGTLKIQQLVESDSGKYSVVVYDHDGKFKTEEKTMLIVQEPVPQPDLTVNCTNKSMLVRCEGKQKTKDHIFMTEIIRDKIKKIQKNATKVEFLTPYSGTFRCVVKNQVSEKTVEKKIDCAGQLDLYLIIGIVGGVIFLVIFIILLIYCIRKKRAERLEEDDEERMMQIRQVDTEMIVREIPQPPSNPTPKKLHVQQRPLPQPQMQQQAVPPRPRPRTQQRTPNHPRGRP